jgi:hypothetical protein
VYTIEFAHIDRAGFRIELPLPEAQEDRKAVLEALARVNLYSTSPHSCYILVKDGKDCMDCMDTTAWR